MSQVFIRSLRKVFKVVYKYDDLELGRSHEIIEFCQSFHDVCDYLSSIDIDNNIVDNEFYKCRSNIRISIKPVDIPESKFVKLFKD